MKIQITKNGFTFNNLLKMVGIGYFIGAGLLFAIPLGLAVLTVPFFGEPDEKQALILSLFMVPIILFLQAIVFSLIIGLGLWLYKKFKKIEIELID